MKELKEFEYFWEELKEENGELAKTIHKSLIEKGCSPQDIHFIRYYRNTERVVVYMNVNVNLVHMELEVVGEDWKVTKERLY